jgi:hypothetical protein
MRVCHAGLVSVLLLLAAAPAAAQKMPPAEPRVERHMRVGLGIAAGTAGLGPAIDFSVNSGTRLYRSRLTAQDNHVGRMGGIAPEHVLVTELAFMLGQGRRFVRNYGSVAAGLSLVALSRGEDEEHATIGIPVEAQLISGGPLRIGTTIIGNVNLQRPFVAFVLSVQLGRTP